MTDNTSPPSPGDVIAGRFVIGRELGRGSFGVVYEAEQIGLNRLVALKFLNPSALKSEGIVQRFAREARLASALTNRHAVTVYDYGLHRRTPSSPPLPFIAMEHLRGRTVSAWLDAVRKPPLEEAIAVLQQTLECLAEAHNLGIVHRDIKPANLFLNDEQAGTTSVRVLDFGIAKAFQGEWGRGTMAPVTAALTNLRTSGLPGISNRRGTQMFASACCISATFSTALVRDPSDDVKISSPPKTRIILRRSSLMFSGMTIPTR